MDEINYIIESIFNGDDKVARARIEKLVSAERDKALEAAAIKATNLLGYEPNEIADAIRAMKK